MFFIRIHMDIGESDLRMPEIFGISLGIIYINSVHITLVRNSHVAPPRYRRLCFQEDKMKLANACVSLFHSLLFWSPNINFMFLPKPRIHSSLSKGNNPQLQLKSIVYQIQRPRSLNDKQYSLVLVPELKYRLLAYPSTLCIQWQSRDVIISVNFLITKGENGRHAIVNGA